MEEIKKEIQSNEKKELVILIVAVLIVLIAGIMGIKQDHDLVAYYEDKIYPGTKINNIDIANLELNKLDDRIIEIQSELKNIEIIIKSKEEKFITHLDKLGYSSNLCDIAYDIYNYGRDVNIYEKLEIIKGKSTNQYNIDISMDNDKINEFLDEISKAIDKEAQNPTININNNEIIITDGENGKQLDQGKTRVAIEKEINKNIIENENIEINSIYKYIKPNYSEEDLKLIDTKISSFTTNHSSSLGRRKNLENAASKINEVVILPGELFSYSQTLGDISYDNGYRNAPVIINGELKDGIGGGICQVSSTMYNAQLKSGILPTMRRNHSKPVVYVEKGLDATVATGIIDYQFENTLDYPIAIKSYVTNNSVVVEFWSNSKANENINYEPKSYVNGNVANTYLYGYDEKGAQVYSQHIDTSVYIDNKFE